MEENIKPVKSKKEKIKLAVLVVSILMIVSSMSYAFFVAATSTPAITDVDLTTETSEALIFTPGTPIELKANLTNFAENAGSLTESTTSTATLRAASSIGSATEDYYVYFNITTNDFVYTVDASTPEMLLTITGPDGEIKTIDGLNYKTVTDAKTGNDISGFDVTTHEGLIAVKELQRITTTTEKTDSWTATITFINLNSDQTGNEGKTFDSELILQQEKFQQGTILPELIITNNGGITAVEENMLKTTFSQVSVTNEGMFDIPDDYGISYYFRGAVDNNWVKFADMYWRIIRINGDGSVRLIYSGTTAPTEEQAVVMTGDQTSIGANVFNSVHNTAEYVGYMYTIGEQHGLTNDSVAKQTLDTWYENSILGTEYEKFVADSLFCGDRTSYTDTAGTTIASGIGTGTQYFGGYTRNFSSKLPTLKCPNKLDAYTVDDEVNGNGALTYPVGLLTIDELTYAGGPWLYHNKAFYLYAGYEHWLISPRRGFSKGAVGSVTVSVGSSHDFFVSTNFDFRAVISLKSTTLATGTGTWDDPYVVSQ